MKKLNSYRLLNKGFSQKLKPISNKQLTKKSLLAAAMPVFSFGLANGQCLGPVNMGNSIVINGNQQFSVDLNGDGNFDMAFKNSNNGSSLKAINVNFPGGDDVSFYANTVASSGSVLVFTGAVGGPNLKTNPYVAYSFGASGAITNGNTGYIGFKIEGTKKGFIQLNVVSHSGTNITIKILERGTDQNGGATTVGDCTSLPVELSALEIQPKADALGLFWATASEENNAGFELQRSRNGQNFKTIAFIEGAGTSVEAQEYFYDDKAIKRNKTYYYRLKQIDYDGQFEYSQVVSGMLHSTDRAVGEFYPNPVVNGTSQIDYTAQSSTTLSIDVYSTAGQLLRSETRDVAAGLNTLAFDFGDLPSGMVFVKIAEGGDAVYKKVMIQ